MKQTEALIAAIDATVEALAELRKQLQVAAATPDLDEWVSQSDTPLPPRVHTRLCRAMLGRGDARASVVKRTHYLRRSAIDEYMAGSPRADAKPSAVETLVRELEAKGLISPGERLEAELAEQRRQRGR